MTRISHLRLTEGLCTHIVTEQRTTSKPSSRDISRKRPQEYQIQGRVKHGVMQTVERTWHE